MEIQDRNNIMQLALNLNFDFKNTQSISELNFMEMVKNTTPTPAADAPDLAPNLKDKTSQAKSSPVTAKERNSKTSASKDSKTQNTADRSKTRSADKKSKVQTNETNYNQPVAKDNSAPVAQAEYIQTQADDTEVMASDTVSEDVVIENDTISNAPTLNLNGFEEMPIIISSDDTTVNVETDSEVLPLDNQPVITKNKVVLPQVTDNSDETAPAELYKVQPNEEDETSHPVKLPQTETPQDLSAEEEIVIRQAQHLDSKINHVKPIKISVNVNAEKIAEPIEKNVLQNSFTLTSMLQSTDTDETLPENEFIADILTTDDTIQQQDVQPQIIQPKETVFAADTAVKVSSLSENNTSAAGLVRSLDISANIGNKITNQRLQEFNNDNSLRATAKEVVEQIKVNITKSAVKGVDTIDIQLKPEDLGKVQIRMFISKDGRLQADIITSRQETADLLQREVTSLSKTFQDAGYDTDNSSFNFSFQNENQAHRQNEEQQLQKFIGETLEQENDTTQANDNLIYDPKVGLNIRV